MQLAGRKLLACQEMPRQCVSSAGTSTTGATSRPIPPSSRSARGCCGTTERNATHAQVNRPLLDEFAGVLDGLEWDVALLQEAPPRWFAELAGAPARAACACSRRATGARALQRALADWNPDLLASGDGGSNQILVRHPGGCWSTAG